jgi:hypothetical protein
MSGPDRAQSELVGTVLLVGLVLISITVTGGALLANLSQQAEGLDQPSKFETTLDSNSLTITHYGGTDVALSDLVLVVRQGDVEQRYTLSDPADRLRADLDTNDLFEGGESITVSHSYTGDVRILLIDTSAGGSVLYDERRAVPTSAVQVSPTIERFGITDTSSDGDASYNVTWNASDDQGDITQVEVALISDGTTVDSAVTTFGGVNTTGVNTDTLTNTSGGGESYTIRLTVTDAFGNTVTATTGDTADSDIGIRSPTIETFEITDVSTGGEVAYDYTYNASDPDGDIVEVTLELFKESTGVRVDNVTDTYTQSAATGEQTGTLTDPAGSKNDGETYRVEILVTDLEGNDVLASATDVADGDGATGGTGSPPAVGRFDVTDTSSGGDASFDVTWNATDVDGNLKNATLLLLEKKGNSGNTEEVDSVTYTSGDFSSGSDTGTLTGSLSDAGGGGKEYVIEVIVYDDEGKTGTQEESVTADGSGGSGGPGSAPTIDNFDVTDSISGGSGSFDVTWSASDVDGNLQDATLELLERNTKSGNTKQLDSVTYTSGDFSSGSDTGTLTGNLNGGTSGNNKEYVVRITVTDDQGNTATREKSYPA